MCLCVCEACWVSEEAGDECVSTSDFTSPFNLINVNDVQFVFGVSLSLMPFLSVEAEEDLNKQHQGL